MCDQIIEILKRDGLSDGNRVEELLQLFRPPPAPRRDADPALVGRVEELLGRSIDEYPAQPTTLDSTPIYMLVLALSRIPETEATLSCGLASIIALQLAHVAKVVGQNEAQVARIS